MTRLRCAILDDYMNLTPGLADWSKVQDRVDIKVFNQPFASTEAAAAALADFEIICAMRERTPFPRALFAALPGLKLLITSGMRNAAIDLEAAKDHQVAVCGTQFGRDPTAPLAMGLILELTRNIGRENARMHAGEPLQKFIGIEIEGRTLTQRRAAGAALLTKIRLAARERVRRTWTVGRFGGFDLTCAIRAGRHDLQLEPHLTLQRTDYAQPIDIDGDTTPAGIIARLEHAIDRMDAELEEHRRRGTDAKVRLAGYAARLGEAFPLQGELDSRLAQLAEIEADLASADGVIDAHHTSRPRAAA